MQLGGFQYFSCIQSASKDFIADEPLTSAYANVVKVEQIIFFLPALVGSYLGFTSENLTTFLLLNSLLNFALGSLIGITLLILTVLKPGKTAADHLTRRDVLMIATMPVLSSLFFSNLFGFIIWGISWQLIK